MTLLLGIGIGLAGGTGAAARWAIGRAFLARGATGPAGTVTVNLVGAFLAGLATAWALHPTPLLAAPSWLAIVSVGFLGSFTTFSTWMVEAVELRAQGRPALALGHLTGLMAVGLLLAMAGLALGARLL